ncbi:MAG: DUF6460 domain-containing protein [Pseudomonadota bacterium]
MAKGDHEHPRADAVRRRLFGGSVARTIIQLIVASIFVGAVFSFLGVGALDFWEGVFNAIRDVVAAIGDSLGEVIVNLITYLLIGAAIVIPIWLIARILTSRRG